MQGSETRTALAFGAFALLAALAPAPQAPAQGQFKELAEARAKVCERVLDFYRESLKAPPERNANAPQDQYASSYEPIEIWSRRLADARLDAAANHDDRLAILTGEVERIKKFSGELKEMARNDPIYRIAADKVEFYQLDAESRLAKEKAGR